MSSGIRSVLGVALAVAVLASITLLSAGGVGIPSLASAAKGEPAPARLLVTAREFRLILSRGKLVAGDAIVQLYNFGEDPHDLRISRIGTQRVQEIGEVDPGGTGELRTRLVRDSRYRLWCSLSGHVALGMEATLRTTKKTASQLAKGGKDGKRGRGGRRGKR